MNIIQQNERNRVYAKENSVYKHFSRREEFLREKKALVLLNNSKVDFLVQELESVDEVRMIIKTKLIQTPNFKKQEKIAFMNEVENQQKLKRLMLQLHTLSSDINSIEPLNIRGVINKGLREGSFLTDQIETQAFERVSLNANKAISAYEQSDLNCFVHGDIQPDNMLFNEDGKLLGLLDWGSSGRGLAETDVRQLPCYFGQVGIRLCEETKSTYNVNDLILINLTLARFLELCFHYSHRNINMHLYNMVHSNLNKFLKIA